MTNTYMDTRSARVEKRARVDLLDLKDQEWGRCIFSSNQKLYAQIIFCQS